MRINTKNSGGYGPPNDKLDCEVIVGLENSPPNEAYGFRLRNDSDRPVRQAMFELLRDSFKNNNPVKIDIYPWVSTRKNFVIQRVSVSK